MNKLLLFLGLAVKAGNINFGFDMTESDIKSKKSRLVIITSDAADRTYRNTAMLCEAGHVDFIKIDACMDDIEKFMGKRAGVISVTDAGFAKRIKELCSLI